MTGIREVTIDELRHLVSPRAASGETMLLNMGPQHPSTHGVLRLLMELDGEIVVNCIPDIGFLHTGIEKTMESKIYQKAETCTDRMDYLNPLGNNLTFSLGVEKLAELEVPPRAQAIRVILAELTRIGSHLLWLGTSGLDLGAMSVFLYAMREREKLLDMFESLSGQRMMTTYIRPGGVWRDLTDEFIPMARKFIDEFPRSIAEYHMLFDTNELFLERTKGVAVINKEDCLRWSVNGPILRAAGMAMDLRKDAPYSGYEQYNFSIPTRSEGDIYARYEVRVDEMEQSLKIVDQALDRLPSGPVRINNRKYVPPPRSEIGVSMEALIHHFKLWTEGYKLPVGSVYAATESPRGELAMFLESDGSNKPYRIHFRTPSFASLQVMPILARGYFVADVVGAIGSIDIVLGDADR